MNRRVGGRQAPRPRHRYFFRRHALPWAVGGGRVGAELGGPRAVPRVGAGPPQRAGGGDGAARCRGEAIIGRKVCRGAPCGDNERFLLKPHLTCIRTQLHCSPFSHLCAARCQRWQARDDRGQARLCGGDPFTARLVPAHACACAAAGGAGAASASSIPAGSSVGGVVEAEVLHEDKGDGSYAVSYSTTVAGVYHLHICLAGAADIHGASDGSTSRSGPWGEEVADSPYIVRVAPGPPVVRHCEVDGAGCRVAVVGRPSAFRIVARDAWGNMCDVASGEELRRLLPLKVGCAAAHGCVVRVEVRCGVVWRGGRVLQVA